MPDKFMIVGLGNPGRRYKKTRHNVGFMVIDRLADDQRVHLKKGRGTYEHGLWTYGGHSIILLKPLTFMNNSGIAVSEAVNYFNIELDRLLVVFDEIELPFGHLRLRRQGSSGGHNGLNSILQHLNTKMFARLRIGIGTEYAKKDMVNFVLSNFSRNEQKELDPVLDRSVEAIELFVDRGIDHAMNAVNAS